jgi:hypothetical protein
MPPLDRHSSVLRPKDNTSPSPQLRTILQDASIRKKSRASSSKTTSKRAKKDLTIVNWKPRPPKGHEIIRNGSEELEDCDISKEEGGVTGLPISPAASTSFLWLKQGQSDPFNAVSIKVTPEINSTISFGRDVFLPTLHHTSGAKQSYTVNNSFQATAIHLSSPGSAFGLLSYFATAASIIGGSTWSRKALVYEVECTRKIREKILSAPISQYPELITQILTLFGCTVLTGRLSEAKTHANVLQKLFDTSAKHGPIDIAKLCFALYHDRNLSAIHLVPSSFDVDVWVPNLISPIWTSLAKPFPYLSETPTQPLDKSILATDAGFIALISDIRNHFHTVILTRRRWPQSGTPLNIITYHITHSLIYETRLINAYLSLQTTSIPPSSLPPHATLLLATLYISHSLLYSGLARLASTSLLLKSHLRLHITSLLTHPLRTHHNLLLWALLIGATAERIGHGHANDGDRWFNTRFRDQVRSMGLTRWEEVECRVQGFPCAEELVRQDVGWVREGMRLVYGRDGSVGGEEGWRAWNGETGGFD